MAGEAKQYSPSSFSATRSYSAPPPDDLHHTVVGQEVHWDAGGDQRDAVVQCRLLGTQPLTAICVTTSGDAVIRGHQELIAHRDRRGDVRTVLPHAPHDMRVGDVAFDIRLDRQDVPCAVLNGDYQQGQSEAASNRATAGESGHQIDDKCGQMSKVGHGAIARTVTALGGAHRQVIADELGASFGHLVADWRVALARVGEIERCSWRDCQ
jgi:hypothetical protein